MSTENANGLLVEAGLDYTTFNLSDTSVGVFARGGPVFWGSDLGTSWRAWGGLSLTFEDTDQPLNPLKQAANAALGFSALVIGRPITS